MGAVGELVDLIERVLVKMAVAVAVEKRLLDWVQLGQAISKWSYV